MKVRKSSPRMSRIASSTMASKMMIGTLFNKALPAAAGRQPGHGRSFHPSGGACAQP